MLAVFLQGRQMGGKGLATFLALLVLLATGVDGARREHTFCREEGQSPTTPPGQS